MTFQEREDRSGIFEETGPGPLEKEAELKTRREFLEGAAALGAVVPLHFLFAPPVSTPGAPGATPEGLGSLSICTEEWLSKGAEVIRKVAQDPDFRLEVERSPEQALLEMGVTLPCTVVDQLKRNPRMLTQAMLGEAFPPASEWANVKAAVPVVVVIYAVTIVVATKAETGIPPEKYAEALGRALHSGPPLFPDFIVRNLTAIPPGIPGGNVALGSQVLVRFDIVNQGTGEAGPARHEIRLFIPEGAGHAQIDRLLATVMTGPLAAGGSQSFTQPVTIPRDVPTGPALIRVIADAPNGISESEEGNNGAEFRIVLIRPGP
jgi:hypothetical protein